MGAILGGPGMGAFSIEVRGESFYLNRACRTGDGAQVVQPSFTGDGRGIPSRPGEVLLPAGDVGPLTVCLGMVVEHGAYRAYRERRPDGAVASDALPAEQAPWQLNEAADGMLAVHGAWIVYGQDDRSHLPKPGCDSLIGTEITYASLPGLAEALKPFTERPGAGEQWSA